MWVCVVGWQLRPWARLSSRYRRGDNVAAAEPREASRDMPDSPHTVRWLVAAGR
jgi:hypothetical protein